MSKLSDPSPLVEGQVFGRLTVLSHAGSVIYGHSKGKHTVKHKYNCLCSCGNTTKVEKYNLLRELTRSCGCLKKEYNPNSRKRNKVYDTWLNAKTRARSTGLDFDIELDDIIIPDVCPVLGFPLKHNTGKAGYDSPSLDRIDNGKGYIKGNVWVISYKANEMKNRYSLEDLDKLVTALKKVWPDGHEIERT